MMFHYTRALPAAVVLGAVVAGWSAHAQAEWVMTGSGRYIDSFPVTEDFNGRDSYVDDLVWIDDRVATFSHESDLGWQGSGAARYTFIENSEEADTFFGYWMLPRSPEEQVRTLHVRWLVYYGADYVEATPEPPKTLIVHRCNADCSDRGESGQRGMVMEETDGTWRKWPYIMENIETNGYDAPRESGKTAFNIADHLGEWISYEAEFDLDEGIARLFIDTRDGEQSSQGGTAPYQVYTDWNTSHAWYSVALMGYWERRVMGGGDAFFMVDEVTFDTEYIGPPEGFNDQPSPPSPPDVEQPTIEGGR